MSDIIHQVEAILFASGKKTEDEYIRKLCHVKDIKLVQEALKELKKVYEAKESSLQVVQEGNFWKLTVRDKYVNLIRKIVPDTEMTKSVMETLAVIAWRQPIIQADVIKVRTNKAYEHIKELVGMGFVTSEKFGRTKKLKLTQKFLDYFDLKGVDDIRELFKRMKKEEKVEEDSKSSEVARLVEGIKQAVEEQNIISQTLEQSDSETNKETAEVESSTKPTVKVVVEPETEDASQLNKLEVYESDDDAEDKGEVINISTEADVEKTKEVNEMLTGALNLENDTKNKVEDEPESKYGALDSKHNSTHNSDQNSNHKFGLENDDDKSDLSNKSQKTDVSKDNGPDEPKKKPELDSLL